MVERYITKFEHTGDVQSTPQPVKLLGDFEQLLLLQFIGSNKGIYLDEIQSKLFDLFGVHCSLATICRTLKYIGFTRQHIDVHRSDESRAIS